MRRTLLLFRDGAAVLAIALTPETATVVGFERDRTRTLGTVAVPPGLIQFATHPRRSIRLGLYSVDGDRVAMLYDADRDFGYAMNLDTPAYSEWGEAPDGLTSIGAPGLVLESGRERPTNFGVDVA